MQMIKSSIKFNSIPFQVTKEEKEEIKLIRLACTLKRKKNQIDEQLQIVREELIKRAEEKKADKSTIYLGGIMLRARVIFKRIKDWNQDKLEEICKKHGGDFLFYFRAKTKYSPKKQLNGLLNNPSKGEETLAEQVRAAMIWKDRSPELIFEEKNNKNDKDWIPVK